MTFRWWRHRSSGRLRCEILDTVLGLSISPTAVAWVLADGQGTDGATLARAESTVGRHHGGIGAVDTSAQATTVVLELQAMLEAQGRRLRGIGVTWSVDAAAAAALLLESLTEAGFDSVVPVRLGRAAEAMTEGVGETGGPAQPAVCVIERGLATVVMPDGYGDDAPAVIQHPIADDDDLVDWLTTLCAQDRGRPGSLVVAGSDVGVDVLAMRLEAQLAMPVFARTGAQLALARGAALALQPGAKFAASAQPDGMPPPDLDIGRDDRGRSQNLPYAGAVAMLAAGVVTFVVSLSATLSLQAVPANDLQPIEHVAQGAKTPVAPVVAQTAPPRVALPPGEAPGEALPPPGEAPDEPVPPPAGVLEESATFASVWEAAPADDEVAAPPEPPALAPPPDDPRSLLTRALEQLPGLPGH